MAGLVSAVHVFAMRKKDVDARDKRGHDDKSRDETIRSSAWARARGGRATSALH